MKKVSDLKREEIKVGHYELWPNWVKVYNLAGNLVFEKNDDYLENYMRKERPLLENYLICFIK